MNKIISKLKESQYIGPVFLSTIVGLLAGFGAITFRYLIQAMQWVFFDGGEFLFTKINFLHLDKGYIIVAPAVGLLIVTMIIQRWAVEARGHGVPEVQYAVR